MKRLLLFIAATYTLQAQTSAYLACGNPSNYTDSTGQVWSADNGTNCSGGSTFSKAGIPINGTPDPTLYQYGRQGNNISATAALSIGLYSIRLKFADVLDFTQPGQQVFNVTINGTLQQANFDIFNTIRAQNTAYDLVLSLYANLTGNPVSVTVNQVSGSAQLQAVSFAAYSGTTDGWTYNAEAGTITAAAGANILVGNTVLPPSSVPLLFEPTNPVVTNAGENSMTQSGSECDLWFAGGTPAPAWTTLYYSYATDATCSQYSTPVTTNIADIRFPYVLLVSGTYYAFGGTGSSTGNIYMWSSTDKTTWTQLNSGQSVLSQGAGGLQNITNVGVVVVGSTWHMFVEAWSNAGGYPTVGVYYSYSTLAAMNWNTNITSTPIIVGANSPMPVFVPDDNAILLFHGQITNSAGTASVISAHYASLLGNLALAGSWGQGNFSIRSYTSPFIADPNVTVMSGKTHAINIEFNYAQGQLWQAYSDLTLDQLYTAIVGGSPILPRSGNVQDTANASAIIDGSIPQAITSASPVWTKYLITAVANGVDACASSTGCWTVAGGTPDGVGAPSFVENMQAALNDYIPVFGMASGMYIDGLRVKTVTACSGTPASIKWTAAGTNNAPGYYTLPSYDLTAAVSADNISQPVLVGVGSDSDNLRTFWFRVTTTGANVNTINAGCAFNLWVRSSIVSRP